MICLKLNRCKFTDWYFTLYLEHLIMPKYAVAVGRKVGIYDTYAECEAQVKNYPNAKFRKFEKLEDAEAFIKQFSGISLSRNYGSSETMMQVKHENVKKPELIKVEKVSPRSELFSVINRLSHLEEAVAKFIADTTSTLENFASRIRDLEGSNKQTKASCHSGEPPKKKPKTDKPYVDGLITGSNGFIVVYTDGACSKNGKMGAQAGIGVWFNEDHPLNISAPVQGPATNNNAEIQAARVAITQAHRAGIRKLTVNTDSKFVINCITQWINKWKKNDWKLATGGPVKNKDELVKLDDAIQLLDAVEWNYVQGHKGIRGNEMADKLARDGANNYKTNVTYSRNVELSTVNFFQPQSDDEDFPNL